MKTGRCVDQVLLLGLVSPGTQQVWRIHRDTVADRAVDKWTVAAIAANVWLAVDNAKALPTAPYSAHLPTARYG
jgi:hypothetical protein